MNNRKMNNYHLNSLNDSFNDKAFTDTIESLTMPKQMAENLTENCMKSKHTGNFLFRYSKLTAAAIIALLLTVVSTTSYAAYDLYQIKNLDVFFDSNISQEQINIIGKEIEGIDGVYQIRFVSADEAWTTFQREYLTDELAAQFTENPLADSYSYRVIVKLNADAGEIIQQISQLDGVRHVTNLKNS